MGLIANYQFMSDKKLNRLKSFNTQTDEVFEQVEEWNEEAEILIDIDKMWDVLHFMLNGVDSSKALNNDPLSEAIIGVSPLDYVEEYIAYIEKTRIKDIVFALENFDIDEAMEKFNMEECKKADLYPNIWDYKDEEDEIKEEILEYFENLKEFYKEVYKLNGNVLVTIY